MSKPLLAAMVASILILSVSAVNLQLWEKTFAQEATGYRFIVSGTATDTSGQSSGIEIAFDLSAEASTSSLKKFRINSGTVTVGENEYTLDKGRVALISRTDRVLVTTLLKDADDRHSVLRIAGNLVGNLPEAGDSSEVSIAMARMTGWALDVTARFSRAGAQPPSGSESDDAAPPGLLLLGDGKRSSTSPQAGYIYTCETSFNSNAGGAERDGEWIQGSYWDPSGKVTVDGNTAWPDASVSFLVNGDARIVTGNGLPSHNTGRYPISPNDDAYQYDRNPNSILQQSVSYTLPKDPTVADDPHCTSLGAVGIAITGAAIFNGLDGPGRDAVAHEIQDAYAGHPERTGEYHYHSISAAVENLGTKVSSSNGETTLLGYILDGFGIFGSVEGDKKLTNTDLDECHGHTHEIVWDGEMKSIYHYHATAEYPYTVGCFRGEPASTATAAQGPDQGQPPGPPPGQRP